MTQLLKHHGLGVADSEQAEVLRQPAQTPSIVSMILLDRRKY